MGTSLLPGPEALRSALDIVRRQVPATPTIRWPLLEQRLGATVFVKH
jgi:threonine dehydratase